MDGLSKKLNELGGAVSDTAERLSDPSELLTARRMLLQAPARPPARRWRPALLAVAAGLLALIVVAVLRPRDRVSFVVGTPPASGVLGEWVAADGSTPLPLQFSEQTSFVLAAGARARVTETTARGATVLLERGTVTASVVHKGPETRWSLQAGPFEVRVTGTRFDASWDPAGDTFELATREGSVVVTGPLLQGGREIAAGERLRVSVREGSMELRAGSAVAAVADRPAPSAAPVAPSAEPAPPSPADAPPPAREAVIAGGSADAAPASAPRPPGWRDLAAAGRYDEALTVAERLGFAQEIERASSKDLAALADAARYAARPALARQALLAQRRRFGAGGASAFVLGKIAADQQGAAADAVRWFETYLREEPNGALAEQALGRILELTRRDPAAARASAQRYLARYPNGVHAPLARSLLSP